MRVKLLILVVLVSCVSLVSGGAILAQTPEQSPWEGLWETEGYGHVFEVAGDVVTVYEVTRVSCLNVIETPLVGEMLPELGMTGSLEDGKLVVRDTQTFYVTAHRIDRLPEVCAGGGTARTGDPELNFEVFWNTFNEQYAFFDLYGVDWQAQYATYRPQVIASTTPAELFAVLSEMIIPLEDGHISLTSDNDEFSPGTSPEWLETSINEISDFIQTHYMSGSGVTRVGNDMLAYQKLSDRVGYILILWMYGYGADDASGETAAAGQAIDQALAGLEGVESLIVDVRFNGGGFDAVALALASRFADQKRLAFSKQARYGDGFTPRREFYIEPGGERQFTGPVFLLTSGITGSAAEIFTMAMGTLPHVTVLGQATSGGHSDILGRSLPNGWSFGLSNEVYYASDGKVYENVGLPPDQDIPFDAEGFKTGADNGVNLALLLAES